MLSACGAKNDQSSDKGNVSQQQTFEWKLVTTWPKNYPGLGLAPENFAKKVEAMSAGRLKIKVFGAGQLVPAFEVFRRSLAGHCRGRPWRRLLLDREI